MIEGIDKFKRDANERGRNARTVSRLLDAQRAKGPLSKGVDLPDGGSLRVHVPMRRLELSIALNPNTGDHAILQTALEFRDESPDKPTIFVTMDVNLRIRADALGLITQTYENSAVDLDRVETGIIELAVTAAELDKFFESSSLKPADADKINPNACVVLRDDSPRPRTALGRFHHEAKENSRVEDARARACSAFARATKSRRSRSICCSTTTSSCSPSSAKPALERRSWRSLRAYAAWSMTAPTLGSWSAAP